MNKHILYLLPLMGLLSFAACTSEEDPVLSGGMGEIRFSVVDTTAVEISTKASFDNLDVDEFKVSLSQGSAPIFTDRLYGDIVGTTITCKAGEYLLTAESCTEDEAESVNMGWGQARVSGIESFMVAPKESKTVELECGLANTSVEVDFSNFIESTFEYYSCEIHATDDPERTFTFDDYNYRFKTAYFNVDESGREISYTIKLPAPYEGSAITGTLTLSPSKSYKLLVKIDGEADNMDVSLDIRVNDELVDENVSHGVNPYE